jgi:predicted AAA+ superfamily ATPase
MDDLLIVSQQKISSVNLSFKRYLFSKINWSNRLIGIKGARGTGKTTLLLQWLNQLNLTHKQKAYLSLDELYFTNHSLLESAQSFYQQGGKVLVLDEVHKYPTWSTEIKNLYDRYDDLKIVFTGSSIIEISRQEADLSRRALMYELWGMSYREYLHLTHNLILPILTLDEILDAGGKPLENLPVGFKPLEYFNEYLRYGYYPFYSSNPENYYQLLRQLCRAIVEYDMAELKGFDIRHSKKMLQLLYVVAQQVPFKPNINNLAQKTQIHRNSINNYLYFLHEARLIHLLYEQGISTATLQKPEKIYMGNTNLLYALSESTLSAGTLREVFFNNQVNVLNRVNHTPETDFVVNGSHYFEVGGKSKKTKQIAGLSSAWVVKDNLEYPVGKSIPLWLFGLLY